MTAPQTAIPDHVPILIVGAGPTGLTAAALLAQAGIDTLTVERREGTTPYSKAAGVQARTLELFERLGIANAAVREGQPMSGLRMMRDGEQVAEIPLAKAGEGLSPYPFILSLEQGQTERLLLDATQRFGGSVSWSTEVLGIETGADEGVRVTLRDGSGETRRLTADWVVGADGASSLVRKATGQSFAGGTYEETFLLIDAEAEGDLMPDGVTVDLLEGMIMAFFPLPGTGLFRVIASIPDDLDTDPDALTADDLIDIVERATSFQVTLRNPRWTSTYRLHHRRAENFRTGRLFLAGDAAHVHSPAGGQGMNTGIGDAFNLAWKLAEVVDGRASEALLDTYAAEREPFARTLLSTTDRAFELMAGRNPITGTVKRRALPFIVSHLGEWKRGVEEAFRRVSQIGIEYRDSVLSIGDRPSTGPAPGDRAPDVAWPDGSRLFDHLDAYRHQLLVFRTAQPPETAALLNALGPLAERIDLVEAAADSTAAAEYGAASGGVRLIRPDGHVAVAASDADAIEFLTQYRRTLEG